MEVTFKEMTNEDYTNNFILALKARFQITLTTNQLLVLEETIEAARLEGLAPQG